MDQNRLEDAWPVDEPPSDFAERVTERVLAEQRPRKPRRGPVLVAAATVLAIAAAVVLWLTQPFESRGSLLASERIERALGSQATAVLEAGARIEWRGREVVQSEGDVFYRVEPGAPFVVKTPAGDVVVLGTCFRVRVGTAPPKGEQAMKRRDLAVAAGSAALAAVAVVTVYEGKVQLSHAGERVSLSAGEGGKLGPDGARKLSGEALSDAEKNLEGKKGSALASANENLAKDISDLNRRLEGIEKEKAKLQDQLVSAERELAKRTDGGAARGRHDFDLDQQDWSELAKDGTIKYRHPCFKPNGWKPGAEQLEEMGLAPDDVESLDAAYKRSYERIWKTIRPLCAKAIGNAEVVDVLGPDTCTHVIVDALRKQENSGVGEAMRQVAEVRAGLKAAPGGKEQHPVYDLFWALTGEMSAFEADLAQSFGPEEAKRLAYSKGMCAGHSTFGGPGPRK